ncbi:unnamed protein product [Clonostachys solani]|uniref:Zn(2)-C6 fungal-type domain-containing protein n=1 Tax=Clonostachys solani TaxID=160281 RepID=A0A9P0EKQ5_9HYPO|nr:unnamed protein product [Clonostachys solani]
MLKRTRTGCISCRIRRVKCDETKPHCQRCKSTRRVCDGYLPEGQTMTRREMVEALSKIGTLRPASEVLAGPSQPERCLAQLPTQTMLSSRDFIYFDYFRRATAPNTDALIPSAFWGQDLLQLAHTEPAIWHATLALGALHRRWELESAGPETENLVRSATSHYGKALSLAKDLRSPAKILALSLPLIASANMLGFWDESHLHILSAFKILAQDSGRMPDAQRIASTLTRMDIQSITFDDSRSPYPFVEAAAVRSTDQGMAMATIESYSQASSTVFALIREAMINEAAYSEGIVDEATYQFVQADLRDKTERFECQMAEFEAGHGRLLNESAAMTIRIYHCWLRFIFTLVIPCPESHFDLRLGYFQRVITLAYAVMKRQGVSKSVQLSLEPALVAPLFDVGKRCRHPALRRHGLQLLQGMNRHEGMWRSDGAAMALNAIVHVEESQMAYSAEMVGSIENYCAVHSMQEEASAVPWDAWASPGYEPPTNYSWLGIDPIPEEQRVTIVRVVSRFDSRQLDLDLLMSSSASLRRSGSSKRVTIKF